MAESTAPAEANREVEAEPYPPAPWELSGNAHLHLLAVRESRLPAMPAGFDPVIFGGFGFVVAGWVDYRGGSVPGYRELLAAPVGRRRGRPTATVTHMWVDSDVSRRGGRELWGYPKEMAEFDLTIDPEGTASARDRNGEIASGSFRAWLASPWRVPAKGGTVQPLAGEAVAVPAFTTGRPALGTGEFRPAPDGPLGWLAGARRIASVGLRDFATKFG
jgi:hypothetical protein